MILEGIRILSLPILANPSRHTMHPSICHGQNPPTDTPSSVLKILDKTVQKWHDISPDFSHKTKMRKKMVERISVFFCCPWKSLKSYSKCNVFPISQKFLWNNLCFVFQLSFGEIQVTKISPKCIDFLTLCGAAISYKLFINILVPIKRLFFFFYCQIDRFTTIKFMRHFLLWMRSIEVLNFGFFFVFSPFLGDSSPKALFNQFAKSPVTYLSVVTFWNFIETFNGPWGLWDGLIELLQDL